MERLNDDDDDDDQVQAVSTVGVSLRIKQL